jgi:predicted PurR-regulated permease PerM
MVLPIPLIILDENVVSWQKTLAILLPTCVQGYVGNFLEPAVFGASLNLTAIAVLLGLVVFAVLWGIPGAVLSVPLLGAIKIVLHHTDHPIAKYFLKLIREDGNLP